MADEIKLLLRAEFQQWPKDKPEEWIHIIALRSALRVWPVTVDVLTARDRKLTVDRKQGLILQAWRANFISSLARRWQGREVGDASRAAAYATSAAITRAIADLNATADVAHTAASAASAASAAALVADAFDHGEALAHAYHAADVAALVAGAGDAGDAAAWQAIACDCRLVEKSGAIKSSTPLWLAPDPANSLNNTSEFVIATPKWLPELRDYAPHLEDAFGPNAGLFDVWYGALLDGSVTKRWAEMFMGEKARDLALKPDEFWEITDTRPASHIMDKIAQVLGWEAESRRDYTEDFSQVPAAFSYGVRDNKIVAQPQSGDAIDDEFLHHVLPELLLKAERHLSNTRGSGNVVGAHLRKNAEDIANVLTDWADTPAPGVLLMRLRTLEAEIAVYDTADSRGLLDQEKIIQMRDLAASLDDLVSMYPSVQKIQARALALRIQRKDVVAINAELHHIEVEAKSSAFVDQSAIGALAEGSLEIEITTQIIETSTDEAKVANAIEQRAETTAHRVLSARNFGVAVIRALQDGVVDGTKDGVKGATSGAIKVGAAALAGAVAGPFVALGQFISSVLPIGRKAKEVSSDDGDD